MIVPTANQVKGIGYFLVKKRTKRRQMLRAEELCSRYLADANQALEEGKKTKAARLYEKSGYWRDRYNFLAGNN